MRVAFMVNRVEEVTPRQTTAMLMHSAAVRGHDVWVFGVDDLAMTTDMAIYIDAQPVTAVPVEASWAAQRQRLGDFDLLMIRTNPGRDPGRTRAHECALSAARLAAAGGVVVLNDPGGLARATSKLCLFEIPQHVRPATFIARSLTAVEEFVAALSGPAVIKPVHGSRGQDVFMLSASDRSNHRQIIEVIRRDGYVMVQEFVPGAEAGDQRVLVVDGKVLECGDRAAVVARVPGGSDFRSNVHVGGTPRPGLLSDDIRAAVADISGWLRGQGLFFVGLDFIAGRIIEINSFSPGGLWDASSHQERDYAEVVMRAAERHAGERLPHQVPVCRARACMA